jgi:hypothetical protein
VRRRSWWRHCSPRGRRTPITIGRIGSLASRNDRAAEEIANDMISTAELNCPPPPEAAREAILHALDLFRTTLIAKMLPVGRILSQALEAAEVTSQ